MADSNLPTNVPHSEAQGRALRRVNLVKDELTIWGWPSRGGLIALDRAGPVDFDFLGLDRFKLALYASSDQDAEDDFCQKLLQLGAHWFDSRDRHGFVANVAAGFEPENAAIEEGDQPAPSDTERRWVSVGVQSDGFWVLEYDQVIYTVSEDRNTAPPEVAWLILARTMEERIQMIRLMGAKFYRTLGEYKGLACINSWETKFKGDFGPLEKTDG